MIRNRTQIGAGLLVLALISAACNLPAPTTPTQINTAAAYTAAAETIIVQLTQVAQTLTPTAPAVASPETPQATAPPETTEPPELEATETSIPSPSPTSPPTATSTLLPEDPRASLGDPSFSDTFSNRSNWPLYDDGHVSFAINNDRLVMTAFDPDFWEGFMISTQSLSDAYLEMTATPRQCAGGDRYGLIARATAIPVEPGGYSAYNFSVTCDGRYALRIWDEEDRTFITLVDWTASEHLQTGSGQTNRIGLLADGEQLSMYANGNLLREYSDDTYLAGRFGLVIGATSTSNLKVDVEEIAYWDLP